MAAIAIALRISSSSGERKTRSAVIAVAAAANRMIADLCPAFVRLACSANHAIFRVLNAAGTGCFSCAAFFGDLEFGTGHHRSQAGNSRERSSRSCIDQCAHRHRARENDRERDRPHSRRHDRGSGPGGEGPAGSAGLGRRGKDNLSRLHRFLQPARLAGIAPAGAGAPRYRLRRSQRETEGSPTRSAQRDALLEREGHAGTARGRLPEPRSEGHPQAPRSRFHQCAHRAGSRNISRLECAH